MSLRCASCGPGKLPRAYAVQHGGHWPQVTCQVTWGSTVLLEGFGDWGHWLMFHPGHECNLKMPSSFSIPLPSSSLLPCIFSRSSPWVGTVLDLNSGPFLGECFGAGELWPAPRYQLAGLTLGLTYLGFTLRLLSKMECE